MSSGTMIKFREREVTDKSREPLGHKRHVDRAILVARGAGDRVLSTWQVCPNLFRTRSMLGHILTVCTN